MMNVDLLSLLGLTAIAILILSITSLVLCMLYPPLLAMHVKFELDLRLSIIIFIIKVNKMK